MKRKSIIIVIILLILLAAGIWYHIPIKIHRSISVCTLDGKQSNVTFDLSWHRFIFSPTELWGTITLDGKKYESLADKTWFHQGSFFDRLKMKLKGEKLVQLFEVLQKDPINNMNNSLYINNIGPAKVSLFVYTEGVSDTYFGPAGTAEEAKKVYGKMNK